MRLFALLLWSVAAYGQLRVAAFRADVTPAHGEPLIWTTPATKIEDPLWAKGIVLEYAGKRFVICAIDWCGIGNLSHQLLRAKLAGAAGTDIARVTVHTVHQHTAPYVDESAYLLLERIGAPVTRLIMRSTEDRIASAVRQAVKDLRPFDRVGIGQANVERVASARRLTGADGKIIVRYSTSGKQAAMAAAPEGRIDPILRTVTLARGAKALVRLHFYATHPQTWCCDGRVSADAVGAARERFERQEGFAQIYFTGCSGDVTVGKYNDESAEARGRLEQRLFEGMNRAAGATTWSDVKSIEWRTASVELPRRAAPQIDKSAPEAARYKAAISAVFAERKQPVYAAAVGMGPARMLYLPGEPMLDFQLFAQSLCQVAVAGYGDIGPGYICTDRAFREGGYEPSASNSAPGSAAVLEAAIRKLLSF